MNYILQASSPAVLVLGLFSLLLFYSHAFSITEYSVDPEYSQLLQSSNFHLEALRRDVAKLRALDYGLGRNKREATSKDLEIHRLMTSLEAFCDAMSQPVTHGTAGGHLSGLASKEEQPQTDRIASEESDITDEIASQEPEVSTETASEEPEVSTETASEDSEVTEEIESEGNSNGGNAEASTTNESPARPMYPDPTPTKVKLSKTGNGYVAVSFIVITSNTATAFRMKTLELEEGDDTGSAPEKIRIHPTPPEGTAVTFTFPESQCDLGLGEEEIYEFRHRVIRGKRWDGIRVWINVCAFVKDRPGIYTHEETVQLPGLDILGGADVIMATRDKDVVVDLRLDVTPDSVFMIKPWMYDSSRGEQVLSRLDVYRPPGNPVYAEVVPGDSDYSKDLMSVEVLNTTREEGDRNLPPKTSDLEEDIRITLNTASGSMSGYLIVEAMRSNLTRDDHFVLRARADKRIGIVKPWHEFTPMPKRVFLFQPEMRSFCQPLQQKADPAVACVLGCRVRGSQIKRVTIEKEKGSSETGDDDGDENNDGNIPKSKFVTFWSIAEAKLNLGHVTDNERGRYVCHVTDIHGNDGSKPLPFEVR